MDPDDPWRDERCERSPEASVSVTRFAMGSRDADASVSLPAIHTRLPTPPAPMANKSKLKPPSQRTVLLSSLANKTATDSGTGTASTLKLPTLVKPTAVATPSKAAETVPSNQETEHDTCGDGGSSRSLLSSGPRGSAVDKHRDFIKDLEEQKRKEKEAQAKQHARRRKMQKKLTEKILQEAALARQKPSHDDDEPAAISPETTGVEETPECDGGRDDVDDEETRQREKEAKRQRKRLLKKQQALLEALQTKKREKQEVEEHEKARERRKQHKLKKAVLDAIHASRVDDDGAVEEEAGLVEVEEEGSEQRCRVDVSPAESVPDEADAEVETETNNQSQPTPTRKKHKKKKAIVLNEVALPQQPEEETTVRSTADEGAGASATVGRPRNKRATLAGATAEPNDAPPDDKPLRVKEKNDGAIHKKQHEYLAKLTEQRRLKQKEDEDAKLVQEKKRRRVQLEAQQRLHEAAAKQQQQRLLEEQQLAAEHEHEGDEKKAVVDVGAMVARLSRLKEKDAQVVPEARDFVSWKKRHGVRSDQKVFSLTGWYPVIREALEARGWFCNEERGSPFFDLKWSLKSDDLKATKLKDDQFVNHFFANTAITTKVGLLHTLRQLPWHQSVDVDALFPRAYDLNEPRDMDAFVMDFRYTFAEGILKQIVQRITDEKAKASASRLQINEAFVAVLLAIGRKKLRAKRALGLDKDGATETLDVLEESVDDALGIGGGSGGSGSDEPVSELEWEVLSRHALDAPGKFRASLAYKKKVVLDAERDPSVVPGEATGGATLTTTSAVDTVLSALEKKQQRQLERLRIDAFEKEKRVLAERLSRVSALSNTTQDELVRLTTALAAACPQFALNGAPSRNVWIVKPAGLSRGRGIRVFNDLPALLTYADVEHHKECQWVAQKYIENPLLVCDRKFDIRQWVLVTSWDPLTVWMHDDFYLRFSSEPYSTDDLSDQYVHLTNNSIQKYSDKFRDVYTTADGAVAVEGNMLHSDEFKQYIARTHGVDDATFEHTLHAQMKAMVVQSLACAQDQVQHRKNACELYGYDFMLDETLRPWLIEVNSSPACDYSTPTAQRYVETGLRGIVQVIVDHREYEARKKSGAIGANEPEPSTGRWRRIHKGEFIGKPVAAFGADFQVKGTKVQRVRGSKATRTAAASGSVAVTREMAVEVATEADPVAEEVEALHEATPEEAEAEQEEECPEQEEERPEQEEDGEAEAEEEEIETSRGGEGEEEEDERDATEDVDSVDSLL